MLWPVQELSSERVYNIKRATKMRLLQKATNNWKKPVTDFVIREGVWGDATVTDFYDMRTKTAVSAGIPLWAFDAGNLTAHDLSAVTSAAITIDDNKWLAIYGFFDIGVEAGKLTGAADTPVPGGSITALQFKRGSSVMDFWKTAHLYSYNEVSGISDTPVIYEENESYEFLVNSTEATEDKFAGLRTFVCEPIGLGHMVPVNSWNVEARALRGVTSVSMLSHDEQVNMVLRAGIDPVQEMTREKIREIYDRAVRGLYTMIVEDGHANSLQDAESKFYIRPFCGVDESAATDSYGDIDIIDSGSSLSGEEHWVQQAADITAGDLKNMITAGEVVADKKYVALFGIADRTANSSLLSATFGDGSGNLDFMELQHLYPYRDDVRGYTERITYYRQNAPLQIKMNFAVARDHYVMPIGLIAETYGSVVSRM